MAPMTPPHLQTNHLETSNSFAKDRASFPLSIQGDGAEVKEIFNLPASRLPMVVTVCVKETAGKAGLTVLRKCV